MRKCIVFILLLSLFLGGCGGTENSSVESRKADSAVSESGVEKETPDFDEEPSKLIRQGGGIEDNGSIADGDTLEVHYLDIGQGDCILVKQGAAAMLIDAGNNNKGTAVWAYLLSRNVEALDYAVGTHPDADHIGGLDVVLYKLDCGTVFLPNCENDTKTYEELTETIQTRNQQVVVPERGEVYSLGKARLEMLTDTKKDYGDNTNDYSLAIRLTFGNTSFLFTGDAEEAAEEDMLAGGLELGADVYKAAHHGADTANTEEFLTAVNPRYCVISCGQDNSYGHPRAGFLNQLRAMGVKVFRTDEQGTIVAVSDGEGITFNAEPSSTWQAGEPTGSRNPDGIMAGGQEQPENDGENGGYFILNTGTGKFHRPDCDSVSQMADRNKAKSAKTKEELMAEGYEPCKNCKP